MKKDWEIKNLGDICLVAAGQGAPQGENNYSTKGTPFIKAGNLVELLEGKSETEIQKVNEIVAKKYKLKKYKSGSVLFAKSGMSCMKGYVYTLKNDSYVVSHLAVLTPFDCLSSFLNYYLQFVKTYSMVKDAAYPTISLEDINNFAIPVPPLEEQKHIVKILDEKFAQLETIKANAQTNLQNAKDLFQSQLTKAFSNTTWEKKRLGDLCSKIGSGATPKGGKDSYKTAGIHLVRSMNVYDNEFVYDELACIDDKQAYELRNVELQEDDVLFNITGGSVCRCCVLPSDVLPARVNQHVSILRPKQELLNPTFLCSAMLGYKEILYKIACAGGSTRQAITKAQLEDFEIPLPPLPEQKHIVAELDTLSEKVRQLQEIYSKQISNCEELKRSLLQKAFEGEL